MRGSGGLVFRLKDPGDRAEDQTSHDETYGDQCSEVQDLEKQIRNLHLGLQKRGFRPAFP